MVSAAKAFSKEPPKKPLTTPQRVAKDFKWRYMDRNKTDQVVEFCRQSQSFEEAVTRAVESRDANGKHHNHQSKVDLKARRKFGRKIIARKGDIDRLVEKGEWPFDLVHDYLWKIRPDGIGPVTVYDVTTRIGAYLNIEPEKVYLHAGVREGIKALLPSGGSWSGIGRVPMDVFPKPFCDMKADEVEDILCTYREVFLTWRT